MIVTFPTSHSGKLIINLYVGVGEILADILKADGEKLPASIELLAVVDTGAEMTVIEERFLEKLGLPPLGQLEVNTVSSGSEPVVSNIYAVEIALAGDVTGVLSANLQVVAATDLSRLGVQMLLGRDVLRRLVLNYDGPASEFTLRVPYIE